MFEPTYTVSNPLQCKWLERSVNLGGLTKAVSCQFGSSITPRSICSLTIYMTDVYRISRKFERGDVWIRCILLQKDAGPIGVCRAQKIDAAVACDWS